MNLRRHLYQVHAEEYDKAVSEHKWPYKLASELVSVDAQSSQGGS